MRFPILRDFEPETSRVRVPQLQQGQWYGAKQSSIVLCGCLGVVRNIAVRVKCLGWPGAAHLALGVLMAVVRYPLLPDFEWETSGVRVPQLQKWQ